MEIIEGMAANNLDFTIVDFGNAFIISVLQNEVKRVW